MWPNIYTLSEIKEDNYKNNLYQYTIIILLSITLAKMESVCTIYHHAQIL